MPEVRYDESVEVRITRTMDTGDGESQQSHIGQTGARSASLVNRLGRMSKGRLLDHLNWRFGPQMETNTRMRFAAEWLAAAQDATPDSGVSALFSLKKGWQASYLETTGYIIPTMLNYSHLNGDNAWCERAMRMADWILSAQARDGSFPVSSEHTAPAIFDTGQAIFGLISAFRESAKKRYLEGAINAAQWLVSVQEPTGAWSRHTYGHVSHPYHTRVAWALLEVNKETKDNDLLEAARKNLEWATKQQLGNGWFKRNGFFSDALPLLHTIAYAARGLLEAGMILHDSKYISSAVATADALVSLQRNDGGLHGVYDEDWRPVVDWSCLTGDAQTAVIWLKLYAIGRNSDYLEAGRKSTNFLGKSQNTWTGDPRIRGAIMGSHPIRGGYLPYAYPNWATKFFLDALMLEGTAVLEPEKVGTVTRFIMDAVG